MQYFVLILFFFILLFWGFLSESVTSSVPPTELNAVGRHSHRRSSPGWRARDHRHSDEGWHQDLGSHWGQAGDCHQYRWTHFKIKTVDKCDFKLESERTDVGKSSSYVEFPISLQPAVELNRKLYVLWSQLNHGWKNSCPYARCEMPDISPISKCSNGEWTQKLHSNHISVMVCLGSHEGSWWQMSTKTRHEKQHCLSKHLIAKLGCLMALFTHLYVTELRTLPVLVSEVRVFLLTNSP